MCQNFLSLPNVDSPYTVNSACKHKQYLRVAKNDTMVIVKGDSAALDNYWREEDKHCLKNIRPAPSVPIMFPDGDLIAGNKKGDVPLHPDISSTARQTEILPHLKSSSLISLGRLCDDGCKIELTKEELIATKNNKVVLVETACAS